MEEKFYYGRADELEPTADYIVGCEEAWKNDMDQLRDIQSGRYALKLGKIKHLSERDDEEPPRLHVDSSDSHIPNQMFKKLQERTSR